MNTVLSKGKHNNNNNRTFIKTLQCPWQLSNTGVLTNVYMYVWVRVDPNWKFPRQQTCLCVSLVARTHPLYVKRTVLNIMSIWFT